MLEQNYHQHCGHLKRRVYVCTGYVKHAVFRGPAELTVLLSMHFIAGLIEITSYINLLNVKIRQQILFQEIIHSLIDNTFA